MLQLSDGTVMCQGVDSTNWYRLTPGTNGSYANGTWTTLAPMHDSRLYFFSQVLRDGRVLVGGGEYGSVTNTLSCEFYQPTNNTWTLTPPIGVGVSDGVSEVLPNGNVMVQPVSDALGTRIFNIASNTWSLGPTLINDQNEASWVKLPDQSILTIDDGSPTSERYIPALNQWIADATVPANLYNAKSELGAAYLLPNGNIFFIGATNLTAIYTPTGATNAGAWVLGAAIPNNLGANDAPSAMMPNGKILCALGSDSEQNPPTYFYEYDYLANAFTQVASPTGGTADTNNACYVGTMLDLPDGTVLFSNEGMQRYVYTPSGSPLASGKPVINNVTQNSDGSYHVTGTLFSGISEGAAYGDDWQMDTDYPIARLTGAGGAVYYARTYNWSSTSVMTGTNIVSTEMTLPAGLPVGTYSLSIVANGIASTPKVLGILPTVPPFQITSIVSTNANNLLITWNTSGTNNIVQVGAGLGAGGNFSTNVFTDLTNLVITTTTTNFLDVGAATNSPARYYRIRSPQ
jgi:galactose oxidase-like protein